MLRPLGKVTVAVAGTPRSIQSVLTAAGLRFKAYHAAHLQALDTNSGKVYIGTSTMVAATRVGCIHILAAPTGGVIPSVGMALQGAAAGIDIAEVYLDVDTDGEGVLLTLLEA